MLTEVEKINGNFTTDDGNSAPDDGNSAPVDGNSAPDDGNSAPDYSNSAPDDDLYVKCNNVFNLSKLFLYLPVQFLCLSSWTIVMPSRLTCHGHYVGVEINGRNMRQ